jgi:hypothetical protein
MGNDNKKNNDKLPTFGYQPERRETNQPGYQPPKSQSNSGAGTPPKKP